MELARLAVLSDEEIRQIHEATVDILSGCGVQILYPPMLAFLKQQQASCTNLIFASVDREKLINAFDPDWQGQVPYTMLIAPEGKLLYREAGSIDSLALKRAILKALNEGKPW